ncbi:hypothetical protein FHX82_005752 [Amycolatopsis bartoniae]|uniref:Transcriptional regulator n=1 Tax=Amycolatopsis bartoniae TaxID=941986 RepID=A0A8H9MGC3_9PSEU|nr:DUF5753 domain-containing protein [Amycolatopsis bartoniae]MBB2938674.1 hypothetical protein [Amycolatopsis bartoniae]TVT11538.1 hypothetical protein FNH07_01575 [Amycolatopsis bartoniae]GHF79322.1 transcriptional regulator [Amycolatopsis bartoniae]
MDVARTPTGRKLQLAALLRYLRERRRLTQHEAGHAVWPKASAGSVQNKLARLESADAGIRQEDLYELLAVYDAVEGEYWELASLLNTGLSQRGRWQGYRSIYSESYRRLIDLEEDAQSIRYVANERIPELLHSESYVRAEFPRAVEGPSSDEEFTVQATLARQQNVFFRDEPPAVATVLSESALRRVQGDEAVMRQQIEFLLELSEHPHVTVQVVPFSAGAGRAGISHKGILERFALLRLALPGVTGGLPGHLDYVFTRTGEEICWQDDVRHYEDQWARASEAALSPRGTRDFLRRVGRDFA